MIIKRTFSEFCTFGPMLMEVPEPPEGFDYFDATQEGIFCSAHIDGSWVMYQLVSGSWARVGKEYKDYLETPPWNSEEELEYM